MKRKTHKQSTPNTTPKKFSREQQADEELSRDVQHLSSHELTYRYKQNATMLSMVQSEIDALTQRRAAQLAHARRLERDREVMRGVFKLRSVTVTA